MKKPKLFELRSDYHKDYDELCFVVTYSKNKPPKYPASASAFMQCYDRQPLSKKWKPPRVVIERRELRTDVYKIEFAYAVNERAKKELSKLVGPYVEFLPVEVVGERREDSDDLKSIKAPPKLYLVNPLVEVALGKGSISHKMAFRLVNKYVFHPDDLVDLPIFRATEDICIVVAESFSKLVKSKGLRGLQFDHVFEWVPSTARASSDVSSKKIAKAEIAIDPPATFSERELTSTSKISAAIWERLVEHWKWICEATILRGGEVTQKPKISKPLSERQLEILLKKIGEPLPKDFLHVLTTHSAKVSLSWDVFDSPFSDSLPSELIDCCGCSSDLWNASDLPQLAAVARKLRQSDMAYFQNTYKGRLPFIEVGNGDHIAFDMRSGTVNCPIVYLSHDDPAINNSILAKSFVEFLMNWSCVGCIGPDFGYFRPFYDTRKKQINCLSRRAERWRKLMANGA